jgi:hypothetical protein
MGANETNFTPYGSRFATHIGDYISLATQFPTIRAREFEALVNFADLRRPKSVLEAPAEGRIIERFLPKTNVVRADMMEVKSADAGHIDLTNWTLANFENDRFDAVLSIVPIHHAGEEEKRAYVDGAFRVLRANGVLAFGEVQRNSKVHIFLDEFVNTYSKTGHVGAYVERDFLTTLDDVGFEQTSSELLNCDWIFDSYDAVFFYVTRLFDLEGLTHDVLIEILATQFGLKRDRDKIVMPWELLFFRGVKPSS